MSGTEYRLGLVLWRDRIERQMQQRTTMLTGVSHDLRTILTRFKLSLALLDRTPERRLLSSRVVQRGHDLEIAAAREREDEVAGAETGVNATVDESGTQARSQALDDVRKVVGRCRI